MKSPAFQFYAADYLADENVGIMTLEEEGAYIRALAYCWREGSIPADPLVLARLLKGASTVVVQMVLRCFIQMPSDAARMVHPRLDRERKKQREWAKKSAEGGKRSGKVRREKKLDAEPNAKGGSVESEPNTNSSSSFSSSSSTKEKQGLKPSVRPEEFANVWNKNRGPLPKVERFTDSRRKKVQARMREGVTLEQFHEAVQSCRGKPFLRGDNDRGWIATFDWLVENDKNIEKAITNPYAGGANGRQDQKRIQGDAGIAGGEDGPDLYAALYQPVGEGKLN